MTNFVENLGLYPLFRPQNSLSFDYERDKMDFP